MSASIDIGHGVSIEVRRYPDGSPADRVGKLGGIAWWHECGSYGMREDWIPLDGPEPWSLDNLDPLTISPSVLCMVCKRHGFIRSGRWEPA